MPQSTILVPEEELPEEEEDEEEVEEVEEVELEVEVELPEELEEELPEEEEDEEEVEEVEEVELEVEEVELPEEDELDVIDVQQLVGAFSLVSPNVTIFPSSCIGPDKVWFLTELLNRFGNTATRTLFLVI